MNRYWKHLVTSTEKRVEEFLQRQIIKTGDFEDGRIYSEIIEGKPTIFLLTDAVALYCLKDSRYYQDSKLLEAIQRGLAFIERWQRTDGSLDFPSCNFYSAPDTAFCVKTLVSAWEILEKYGVSEAEKALAGRYLIIILKSIPILLFGGFHTPNHRWAVTSVLLIAKRLAKRYPQQALAAPAFETPFSSAEALTEAMQSRIDAYLREGIDGNDEGEYAERSTGTYNAVVDDALISMYEETGNEDYLGYVARNLEMMLYYFEPDDTVFTQNSTRQDFGKKLYPNQYFSLYLYMAEKTGNPLFDKAAHKIIKDNTERGDLAPDCLYLFMVRDFLKDYTFKGYGFLPEYRKVFKHSGVLRVKKSEYSYSVLNQSKNFLFVKFFETPVSMRIGESYCDIRNFIPDHMQITEDGCKLQSEAAGWYYQPFEESTGTSDWWQMDHSKREKIITSRIATNVSIKELPKGLEVTVETLGLEGLPLRVELRIPAGVVLENQTISMKAPKGESMILKDSYITIRDDIRKIRIGPGYGTHAFSGHYSGEESNEGGFTIYLNDYTPCKRTFRIESEA